MCKERSVFCLASLKYHLAPTRPYFLTVTMPQSSERVEVFKMRFKFCVFAFLSVFNCIVSLSWSSTVKLEWISLMKLNSRESMLFKFALLVANLKKTHFLIRLLFSWHLHSLHAVYPDSIYVRYCHKQRQAVQEWWHKKWPKLKRKKKVLGQLHYWLELVRISCGKLIYFPDIIDLCVRNRNGKPKMCPVISLCFPLCVKVQYIFHNSAVTWVVPFM